jgi:hypothetical protein
MFRKALSAALILTALTTTAMPAAHAGENGTSDSDGSFSVFGALLHRPVIFVKSIATGADNGAKAGAEAFGMTDLKDGSQLSLPVLGAACVGATVGAVVEPIVNTVTGKDPDLR